MYLFIKYLLSLLSIFLHLPWILTTRLWNMNIEARKVHGIWYFQMRIRPPSYVEINRVWIRYLPLCLSSKQTGWIFPGYTSHVIMSWWVCVFLLCPKTWKIFCTPLEIGQEAVTLIMTLFQFEQFTSVVRCWLIAFLGLVAKCTQLCVSGVWSAVSADTRYGSLLKVDGDEKKIKRKTSSSNPVLLASFTRGCVGFPCAFPLGLVWKTQLEPAEARQGHTWSDLPQPPSAILHLHLRWPWMRVTLFMLMRQGKHPSTSGHVTVHHPKPHLASSGGGSDSSYLYCYGATLLTFTSAVLEAGVRMIPPSFLNQIQLFHMLRIEEPTFRPTVNNFIWIKRWTRKMWALNIKYNWMRTRSICRVHLFKLEWIDG